jgi:hypothetical protein
MLYFALTFGYACETDCRRQKDGVLGKRIVALDQDSQKGKVVLVVRPGQLFRWIPHRRRDRRLIDSKQRLVFMDPVVVSLVLFRLALVTRVVESACDVWSAGQERGMSIDLD